MSEETRPYMGREDLRAAREAREARERARRRARNNRLMGNADFRDLLDQIADRCGLLARSGWGGGGPFAGGYRAGLTDLVKGIVANSDGGPEWLAQYARAKSEGEDGR